MSDLIRIMSGDGKAIGETRKLADGTPVRTFKRYVAKVGGTYYKKGWDEPLRITQDYASHLLSQWEGMKAVGHPVKITADHKSSDIAENIMGDALDMAIEQKDGEPWLAVTQDVRGQKNIDVAEVNKDQSIEIYPEIRTGSGKVFKNAIKAITFTPIPVVGSQPIAASLADDDTVYTLSTENPMDAILKDAIAKLAGVKADTVTEANAASLIDTARATATAEIKKLSTASHGPDVKYLSMAARTCDGLWERAVERNLVDVQTRDGFKSLLIGVRNGKDFAPSPLMLSMGDEPDASIDLSEKVIKLLENNKPVATGAKLLSTQPRFVPDGDNKTGTRKVTSPYTGKEIEVNA